MLDLTEYKEAIANDEVIDIDGLTIGEYINLIEYAGNYIELSYPVLDDALTEIDNHHRIVVATMIHPENPQHLITGYMDENDVNYCDAMINLQVTTQYHEFSDTAADRLLVELEPYRGECAGDYDNLSIIAELIDSDIRGAYHKAVNHANEYGDYKTINNNMTAQDIFDLIHANAN
jgi:hypothetical protein